MDNDTRERIDAEENRQLTGRSQEVGMQAAMRKQEEKIQNPNFLDALRDADIDSELFGWLEDEYPTWFSGAHAVGNRKGNWDQIADLMMKNKRERALAERQPGRLLRSRPFLLATMQDADTPLLDAYMQPGIPGNKQYWRAKIAKADVKMREPMTSDQQTAMYGGAEVAADLMTLSRQAAGLEATSTATTETRVHREENEKGTASRLGRFME